MKMGLSHYIWHVTCLIGVTMVFSTASEDPCSGHVSQTTGTCYTSHDDAVTWIMAAQTCRSRGGYLAAFMDTADQDVLRYLYPGRSTSGGSSAVWIGGYHTQGNWAWIENGGILSAQGCYSDKWEINLRDLEREITVTDLTPQTCIDACTAIIWPKTYQYAAVQSGNQCHCGNATYGRYGTNSECTIKCPTDTSKLCGGMLMNFIYMINGAYGVWAYAQPNNYKGNQNCGALDTNNNGKMTDESCYKLQAFMCEIVATSSCPGVIVSRHYVYYAPLRRCYHINDTKVSWYDAKRYCTDLVGGGRLVTIESREVHDVVRNITTTVLPVAQKMWIGLYKGIGWQWSTGAAFNFSNWASSKTVPGNPLSVATCATVNLTVTHAWVDTTCDTLLPYICQSGGNSVPADVPPVPTRIPTDDSDTTVSVVTPDAGASTGEGGISTLELVLAIVMSLLGLLLLILLIFCIVSLCNKRDNKIHYYYDARPIAPVPDSGLSAICKYDDDTSEYNTGSTTLLHTAGPW